MLIAAASIFSVLLVATGVVKIFKPADTEAAIRLVGAPGFSGLGRVLGAVEVLIGVGAMTLGRPSAWLVQAGAYTAFLVWMFVAHRKGVPIETCGCLGKPDTPPYWGHVAIDSMAAGLSLGAMVSSRTVFEGLSAPGVLVTTAVVALGAALAWVVIGEGARLQGTVTQ